jgi:hypothetical protein
LAIGEGFGARKGKTDVGQRGEPLGGGVHGGLRGR